MPDMNALVPSIGSMTQVIAGTWPLVPVLLSEDAVTGAGLFDQRADRGFGLAVGHCHRRVTGDVVLVLNRQRLPEMAQDDGTRRIRKLMYQREIFAPRLRFLHSRYSLPPPDSRRSTACSATPRP